MGVIIIEFFLSYVILFPSLLIIEFLVYRYYKSKGIFMKTASIIGWQIFACIVISILYITNPGNINDVFQLSTFPLDSINLELYQLGSEDQMLHTLLFIPLGAAIPLLWKQNNSLLHAVLSGFFLSLIIEVLQTANMRVPDINDLCMNTLGTLCGFGIYTSLLKKTTYFQIDLNVHDHYPRVQAMTHILILFLLYFFIGASMIESIFHFI